MPKVTGTRLLTEASIRAWLRSTAAAPLHDGGGLYLRRRAGGAYWALRQVNPLTSGRTWAALLPGVAYPTASLQMAREEADKARLLPVAHTDLVRSRAEAKAAMRRDAETARLEQQRRLTVRQLFDRWAETELTPRLRTDGTRAGRKDGGEYARQQFERRVFPVLGSVAARDVTRADLLGILDAAKAEGKLRTCNVLLADLKQMMRFAVARDIVTANPLESVSKRDAGGVETERNRVLSVGELELLFERLPGAGLSERAQLAIPLILATGCRVGELMAARQSDVDLEGRTWHLPTTKNQRDHTIHLSEFAAHHFRALLDIEQASHDSKPRTVIPTPWLFPNADRDGPVCVKAFGKQLADRQRPAVRRLKGRSTRTDALQLPGGHWTAHDLRRTAATLMAALGVSGDVIDECLNHVIESRVRRTYIRDRRPAEQADAFDKLGDRLDQIRSGQAGAVVVALPLKEAA